MTDLDSVNPFAAPKQPTISTDPTIDDPIRYQATPTIGDLNAALRPVSAIVPAVVLLSLLLFCFIGILLGSIAGGQAISKHALLLSGIFLFGSLMTFYLFTKLFAARIHLRRNPDAIAPLTGELTSDGLRLRNQNCDVWHPHEAIVLCHRRNGQLIISHDPYRAVFKILPTRGFSDANLAARFLEFSSRQPSTTYRPHTAARNS